MTNLFSLKAGKVIGRSHILAGKNCQDAYKLGSLDVQGKSFHVGWISDGCSAGAHSEVGSNLAAEFLYNQSVEYLKDEIPLEIIPLFLFEDLISFLKSNLKSHLFKTLQDQALYINNYLLFTLTGFIIGPNHGLVMAYGDGLVIINDQVYKREFNDESPYVGYLLIDSKFLNPIRHPISEQFDVYPFKTDKLKKLAIGDDAWLKEYDLISQVWGHKHPNQVQRNMNIWSDEKKLIDDATIIVVEANL